MHGDVQMNCRTRAVSSSVGSHCILLVDSVLRLEPSSFQNCTCKNKIQNKNLKTFNQRPVTDPLCAEDWCCLCVSAGGCPDIQDAIRAPGRDDASRRMNRHGSHRGSTHTTRVLGGSSLPITTRVPQQRDEASGCGVPHRDGTGWEPCHHMTQVAHH